MPRPVTLIGAPSNIGIRPYDDGQPRGLDRAPGVLRQLGLAARLAAEDAGDVSPPPYRDFIRGDCSIVLGSLLGAGQATGGPVGLVYIDAHADFATPVESRTGSVASMCLGLAVGRGDSPLARLGGPAPLVEPRNVALIGRRDAAEPWYGHAALARSQILDLPDPAVRQSGWGQTAAIVVERMDCAELSGFWIHLDADVLDPAEMPAVDSPTPGGPGTERLVELLGPLVGHPRALGLELTIYDPLLDPGLAGAERLVNLIQLTFQSSGRRAAG